MTEHPHCLFDRWAESAILQIVLVFRLCRRGRQLRTAAFQPVPTCLAAVRIPVKSLTNGFPRVSGSGILFEADEFRIIDLCPSSNSVADTRIRGAGGGASGAAGAGAGGSSWGWSCGAEAAWSSSEPEPSERTGRAVGLVGVTRTSSSSGMGKGL